jgi:hypothetical protein
MAEYGLSSSGRIVIPASSGPQDYFDEKSGDLLCLDNHEMVAVLGHGEETDRSLSKLHPNDKARGKSHENVPRYGTYQTEFNLETNSEVSPGLTVQNMRSTLNSGAKVGPKPGLSSLPGQADPSSADPFRHSPTKSIQQTDYKFVSTNAFSTMPLH